MTNATTSNSILDDVNVQRAVSIAFDDGVKAARKRFKEYLEKKKADIKIELRKNMSDVVNHSFSSVELALIDEIINELFNAD